MRAGLGDAVQCSHEDFLGALRLLGATSGGALRSRFRPPRPSLGSTWRFLPLRTVLQDALGEVMKVYPPLLKSNVFVDITAFMEGRNLELAGNAEAVLRAMRREVEEQGLQLSITEGERKGRARSLRHAVIWKRSLGRVVNDKESVLQADWKHQEWI